MPMPPPCFTRTLGCAPGDALDAFCSGRSSAHVRESVLGHGPGMNGPGYSGVDNTWIYTGSHPHFGWNLASLASHSEPA